MYDDEDAYFHGDDDVPSVGVLRPGTVRPGSATPPPVIPAGRGWRVRTKDRRGKTVILQIAAWVADEDGDVFPWVVTPDRREICEVDYDYVILQPGEPDDAVVGDDG